MLTTDKNMRYQQNLDGRKIAVVVLSTGRWTLVKLKLDTIAQAIDAATPGRYFEVPI